MRQRLSWFVNLTAVVALDLGARISPSPTPSFRVLGIDPGSVVAGWGVVVATGSTLRLEASGVVRPPKSELPDRLVHLHRTLTDVLALHTVDAVAIEAVFHARHARSALILGHARGVLLLAAAQRDLPVFEYPPATVKKAVTGDGAATKESVRMMVQLLLKCEVGGPLDQSDALAVAITHAQVGRFQGRLAALESKQRAAGRTTRHPALRLKLKETGR